MFKYVLLLCLAFSALQAYTTYEDYTMDPEIDYTDTIVEHLNSISDNLKRLNSETLGFEVLNFSLNSLYSIVLALLASVDDTEAFICLQNNYEVIGNATMTHNVDSINALTEELYSRQEKLEACENSTSIIVQAACKASVLATTQFKLSNAVSQVESAVASIDIEDQLELSKCVMSLVD